MILGQSSCRQVREVGQGPLPSKFPAQTKEPTKVVYSKVRSYRILLWALIAEVTTLAESSGQKMKLTNSELLLTPSIAASFATSCHYAPVRVRLCPELRPSLGWCATGLGTTHHTDTDLSSLPSPQ